MARSIRSTARNLIGLFVFLLLAACDRQDKPTVAAEEAISAVENVNDPQWVYRDPQHPNKIAIVFVHGIIGDIKGTWTNSNGKTFFEFVRDLADIGNKVDVYAFGFSSRLLANGSLKIGEAANKLNDYVKADGIDKYEQIIFVAHSMGGLITMRNLISHPEIRSKVPLLVFYSTPYEGAQIATIGQYALRKNPAVRQMIPVNENDYLQQINEDWTNIKSSSVHPIVICAYETKPVSGMALIVPWSSGTRNCDRTASAIEDSDHMEIVKPDRERHPSVIVLSNALNEFVAPKLNATALDTPDFIKNSDPWSYVIEHAGKRNKAVFVNRLTIPVSYSLEVIDSTYMIASQPMPRTIDGKRSDVVDLILLNPLRSEYPMRLKIGAAPERVVIARIPDMKKAILQRNELEAATAEYINANLQSAMSEVPLSFRTPGWEQKQVIALAKDAIARQQPELPQAALSILTADMLIGLNLSNIAAVALGDIERQFPQIVMTDGMQRLAGIVAARTGNSGVLKTVDATSISTDEAMTLPNISTKTDKQRQTLATLAKNLQKIPVINVEGHILMGDLLHSQGDQAAAKREYLEIGEQERSPLVWKRLEGEHEI